jgi:hypothetical protein
LYDGQSPEKNAWILEAEFENMVQGEVFQSGFENLALEYETSLPSKLSTLYSSKISDKFSGNSQSFVSILHMLSLAASWMKA